MAFEKVKLFALFENKVILLVDDQRRVLAKGETSPEGITLLATDTAAEQAEVEIDGKSRVLRLRAIAAGGGSSSEARRATLWMSGDGHFYTDGYINGQLVRFMVDTGATNIALNGTHADKIGLDYRRLGQRGYASTAAGVVQAWYLRLTSVKVGDIALYNVEASVIEGKFPEEILLGMSFLGRLNMEQDGRKLEFVQRY